MPYHSLIRFIILFLFMTNISTAQELKTVSQVDLENIQVLGTK
jgi:hypothetical protein